MAFEGLTQRLAGTFKKLKNRGKLSEAMEALLVLGYTRAEASAALKDMDIASMELE